jgi:SAM-dependent methyltransferase
MTATPASGLESKVVDYYERKLQEHGATAAGVDWNSEESQRQRFVELCRVIEQGHTVLDVGCGYGGLLEHLQSAGWSGDYIGFDLSSEMIDAARRLHPGQGRFVTTMPPEQSADIVVASGLFNVKLDTDEVEWKSYVDQTILSMYDRCRVGLAFNLLTSYSDPDRMRPTLHYGSPSRYFDFVATHCSRRVSLLHDYGLYEFTILVRR